VATFVLDSLERCRYTPAAPQGAGLKFFDNKHLAISGRHSAKAKTSVCDGLGNGVEWGKTGDKPGVKWGDMGCEWGGMG
jgi:hypothetical protein